MDSDRHWPGDASLPHLTGGLWHEAARRVRRDPASVAALAILTAMALGAGLADFLAGTVFHYGLTEQDLLKRYSPPTLAVPAFWLGADELGRSQVVRLLYGARVSIGVALGAVAINLLLGVTLGLLAGYVRGWFDAAIQFLISTLESIPRLFLLLAFSVLFTPGPVTLVLVIGLLSWPTVALFVRGQTLSLREREFVLAAQALGASPMRVVGVHLLPNVLPLVIVIAAVDAGSIILLESALSFLGLGIQPPLPSWGNMLSNAASNFTNGPWLVYVPGTAIFLTVLSLYLLGDSIRDALDPRTR